MLWWRQVDYNTKVPLHRQYIDHFGPFPPYKCQLLAGKACEIIKITAEKYGMSMLIGVWKEVGRGYKAQSRYIYIESTTVYVWGCHNEKSGQKKTVLSCPRTRPWTAIGTSWSWRKTWSPSWTITGKKTRVYSWIASCTLQRNNTENLKQIFPEKELRGNNFHNNVSVSGLYIPMIELPILLQQNMWTNPGNI